MENVDLISLIGQIGFPMAVAAYLLIKVEKTLKELMSAVQALTGKVGELVLVSERKGGV